MGLTEAVGVAVEIEAPAAQACARFERIGRRAVGVREQRRFLELHYVGDDAVAIVPGVHDMEDVAAFAAKPGDVLRRALAFHDADEGALVRLPGVRRLAGRRTREASGEGQYRKQ